MSRMLTRETILQADDLQTKKVPVPEWGGSVLVRGLTGSERDMFEASVLKQDGKKQRIDLTDIRAKLIVRCVVDESGASAFTAADVSALSAKSGVALQRIFVVAQKLSGLSDDDIDELTKTSDGDANEGSTSNSPASSPNGVPS